MTQNLYWDDNVEEGVRKSNARIEFVKKLAHFGVPEDDIKTIYFVFIRSLLEQSATLWHSSLNKDIEDLERVQKSTVKIILKEKYHTYNHAIIKLRMETLHERREQLCLSFAQN